MKKVLIGITLLSTMILFSGCTKEQYSVIFKQSGTFASVGWIASENPSDLEKRMVIDIVNFINDNLLIENTQSYTETLYAPINQYVANAFPIQYRPALNVAAMSILGGLDILMAANPSIKQSDAMNFASSFCGGAKIGLGMTNNDPVIRAAVQSYSYKLQALSGI